MTDGAGDVTGVNRYDNYGAPGSGNLGRFQFTGQMWLEEAGLYHYKARAYHPALGRFMQADPIGYGDGMHLYAYVGNDPVNARDPSGMTADEIIVQGTPGSFLNGSLSLSFGAGSRLTGGHGYEPTMEDVLNRMRNQNNRPAPTPKPRPDDEIVVTATRPEGGYLDGLVSTGFFSCDGLCLPTIDYYFDELGVTIIAERKDYTRVSFQNMSYGQVYLSREQAKAKARLEFLCAAATVTGSTGFIIAGYGAKKRQYQLGQFGLSVGVTGLIAAYAFCETIGISVLTQTN